MSSLASHGEAARLAVNGGDDYELLFTVRKGKRVPREFRGLRLTRVGEITRKKELLVRREDGEKIRMVEGGWDPFRG